MTWLAVVPPLLAAFAMILVPGLVATAPLRLRIVARVAVSGVVGVAALGLSGVVFGLLHVPYAPWQPLVPALLAAGVALVVRRRWPRLALPPERVRAGWLAVTWVLATALIVLVAFIFVPSPERFSQTYDNVFHLSAIAHILQTGDASSLTLRTVIETGRTWAFYPAGWHTLVVSAVELTGASIPVAINAAWIAVCGAVWLPGVAWLAQVLVRRQRPGTVALVALPLGAAFGAFPFSLLSWGTLYPTFLAGALLPGALAIPLATWHLRRTVRREDRSGVWLLGALGTLAAVAAIAAAQPRALATWALLLAPVVVGVAASAFLRGWRRGGRSRRRAVVSLVVVAALIVVGAVAAFVYAVVRLGLFDRPLDERLGGPQAAATQSVLAGIVQVLTQSWPTGVGGIVPWPALLLAAAVAIGAVVAARTRGLRWIVVASALAALLFALAAGSDDVVTKLATALWYKDRYRLSSAVPVLGVVLATLGIFAVSSWVSRWADVRRRIAVVLSWIVAATSAAVLIATGASAATATVFRLPEAGARTEIASAAQLAFLSRVAEIVPPGSASSATRGTARRSSGSTEAGSPSSRTSTGSGCRAADPRVPPAGHRDRPRGLPRARRPPRALCPLRAPRARRRRSGGEPLPRHPPRRRRGAVHARRLRRGDASLPHRRVRAARRLRTLSRACAGRRRCAPTPPVRSGRAGPRGTRGRACPSGAAACGGGAGSRAAFAGTARGRACRRSGPSRRRRSRARCRRPGGATTRRRSCRTQPGARPRWPDPASAASARRAYGA